jgi:DNA-binding Lrp family transcriptional regulator
MSYQDQLDIVAILLSNVKRISNDDITDYIGEHYTRVTRLFESKVIELYTFSYDLRKMMKSHRVVTIVSDTSSDSDSTDVVENRFEKILPKSVVEERVIAAKDIKAPQPKPLPARKEYKVLDALDKAGIDFIHNKKIAGSPTAERPDFLIDYGKKYKIIIEVDEHQHKNVRAFDGIRMNTIRQGLPGCRVVFVRFNPDKFDGADISMEVRCRNLVRITYKLMRGVNAIDALKMSDHIVIHSDDVYMYYDRAYNPAKTHAVDINSGRPRRMQDPNTYTRNYKY